MNRRRDHKEQKQRSQLGEEKVTRDHECKAKRSQGGEGEIIRRRRKIQKEGKEERS